MWKQKKKMKRAATRRVRDGKFGEISSQQTSHLIERMMIESFTMRYMRICEYESFPSREAFNEFRLNVLFMNHETSKEDVCQHTSECERVFVGKFHA